MRYTLLMLGILLTPAVYAGSLRTALDNAWERSPQAQILEARRAEYDARRVAANSLLPGAPALVLGHRSDRLNNDGGQREWEAGIALPIWLPGQRDARQRQEQANMDGLEANIGVQRLKLAGELREAIWHVRQAEAQTRLNEARLLSTKKLSEDVAQRVRAGELARTDLNLAQNEWRAAQAANLQSRDRLLQAQQAYTALTGMTTLPDDMFESVPPKAVPDSHPLLKEARLSIEMAQAQVRVASSSARDNPELEISMRRERDNLNTPYAGTVAISLRLPFSTDARKLPLVSAAHTALSGAQSEYQRTLLTLEYQGQQAEQAVQTAAQLLDLAQQQRGATRENLELIQKSFKLGESGLPALLRASAAALEAEQACIQQEIAQALARARLNQAQGVLP